MQDDAKVLAAHMQEGFRATDLRQLHQHCQLKVIVIRRHQADMAGTHAKAVFTVTDSTQIGVHGEMHSSGETHFIAADAPGNQIDRRL
ncbi:hypothetical protein D3C75_960830 [compost metagenome]